MHHCLIQVVNIKVDISKHLHDMQWKEWVGAPDHSSTFGYFWRRGGGGMASSVIQHNTLDIGLSLKLLSTKHIYGWFLPEKSSYARNF